MKSPYGHNPTHLPSLTSAYSRVKLQADIHFLVFLSAKEFVKSLQSFTQE